MERHWSLGETREALFVMPTRITNHGMSCPCQIEREYIDASFFSEIFLTEDQRVFFEQYDETRRIISFFP